MYIGRTMQIKKKYYSARKRIKRKEYIKKENDKGNGKKNAQW